MASENGYLDRIFTVDVLDAEQGRKLWQIPQLPGLSKSPAFATRLGMTASTETRGLGFGKLGGISGDESDAAWRQNYSHVQAIFNFWVMIEIQNLHTFHVQIEKSTTNPLGQL